MPSAEEVLRHHPEWYHSIELAPGIVTPGRKPLSVWQDELRGLRLPDLAGKSVLDIGAFDGFFSFAAERLGAARVVALDHYAWSADMASYMRDWRSARKAGRSIPPPHLTEHWRPAELPGREPFDAAHRVLNSRVQAVVNDFMAGDSTVIGSFDIVLFLGVLYHLENPLAALRRVFELTAPGGLCVIETEAMEIPGSGSRALFEFFPGDELHHDASNWWAPNGAAMAGLCRAAGFSQVEILAQRPRVGLLRRISTKMKHGLASVPFSGVRRRYRLIAHATRAA